MIDNTSFIDLKEEITQALGIDLAVLIAHIIAVIVIFTIIYIFVWKKVLKHLEKRQNDIKEEIESASKLNAEANKHKVEMEGKLHEASRKANDILNQANADASHERTIMIKKATKEVENLIGNARVMIDTEKKQQLEKQNEQHIISAYKIARGILGREISNKDQEDLVKGFIKDIKKEDEE